MNPNESGGIHTETVRELKYPDFVHDDVLPKNRVGIPDQDLISLGFVLGRPIDEEFIYAKVPPGWSKDRGKIDNWYVILDKKGRVRSEVYYCHMTIRYRASMNMVCRYTMATEPVGGWGSPEYVNGFGPGTELMYIIFDAGKPIFVSDKMRVDPNGMSITVVSETLRNSGKKWLNSHYPHHRDYMAYWDD